MTMPTPKSPNNVLSSISADKVAIVAFMYLNTSNMHFTELY